MNDILKNYSQDEIELLALQQLEEGTLEETATLKIVKIDKEYKKHNSKAITSAIINAGVILLLSSIVLNSESNMARFSVDDISLLFDDILNQVQKITDNELLLTIYAKMFDSVNAIIEKIGLIGLILVTRSCKLILQTVKDTKKTLKMKKELKELQQIVEKKDNYTK